MDKILDMIAHWSPFGQGIFFLIVLSGIFAFFQQIFFYIVVLFQGWPKNNETASCCK
jgi:hypothetical protein